MLIKDSLGEHNVGIKIVKSLLLVYSRFLILNDVL